MTPEDVKFLLALAAQLTRIGSLTDAAKLKDIVRRTRSELKENAK